MDKKKQKVDLGDAQFESVVASMAKNQPTPPTIYDLNSLTPQPIEIDDVIRNKMRKSGYLRRLHVKFVKKISPVQEAVFFAGGEESANQVIEWVHNNGDIAEHVRNQKGMIPEWIRIVGVDVAGDPVRTAVRPNWWVVSEGNGEYSKVQGKHFDETYQEIPNEERSTDV